MAQHVPLENFKQKAMVKMNEAIRRERGFMGSLKYERLHEEYNETPDDMVFATQRTVPKSIAWFKPTIEVHTKPDPDHRHRRIPTNIYLVA